MGNVSVGQKGDDKNALPIEGWMHPGGYVSLRRYSDGVPLVRQSDALAIIEQLQAENARLRSAIRWALGAYEGDPDFSDFTHEPPTRYAWRTELRRRAAMQAQQERS